jgi:hypothetical protein
MPRAAEQAPDVERPMLDRSRAENGNASDSMQPSIQVVVIESYLEIRATSRFGHFVEILKTGRWPQTRFVNYQQLILFCSDARVNDATKATDG